MKTKIFRKYIKVKENADQDILNIEIRKNKDEYLVLKF